MQMLMVIPVLAMVAYTLILQHKAELIRVHIVSKEIIPYHMPVSAYLSLFMRKPAFCKCKNKDADQLCGNREADQRLCFRYIDSKIHQLSKSEISSL